VLSRSATGWKCRNAAGPDRIFSGRWWPRQRRPLESVRPYEGKYLQHIIDVRHLLAGEWVWDVLVTLNRSPAQYTELLATIQGCSGGDGWPGRQHRRLRDGTLNRTLRRLEQAELVESFKEKIFPYRTTYQLTEPAGELLESAMPLVLWAGRHGALVSRVKERRRAEDDENS
jgi:DNA-binding HxlR family transcriptional regulator